MAVCGIALGGNIGDSAEIFRRAIDQLESAGVALQSCSSVIRTSPMGAVSGGTFSNAAAIVETSRSPTEFLQQLHAVERGFGRTREQRWSPRPLDLDLLFYDDCVIDSEEIVLPHPALWYRRFVLEPLRQVVANWVHPILGESTDQLFKRIDSRPLLFEMESVTKVQLTPADAQEILMPEFDAASFRFGHREDHFQSGNPPFARILFEPTMEPVRKRSQPQHSRGRLIRLAVPPESGIDDHLQALRDVLCASLG